MQCFAGFDLSKHKRFSTKSPSIQIPITTLHKALQDGFSFTTKGNNEIAIGFRPDQFLSYILNADLLHAQGADAKMADLLARAAALEPLQPADLAQVGKDRQRVVVTVSRLSRVSDFRRQELIRIGLNGGIDDFKTYLNKRIHLPADKRQWPNVELIKRANTFRGLTKA